MKAIPTRLIVLALRKGIELDCDFSVLGPNGERIVNYAGPGWYSMRGNGKYQRGRYATTSRIKITKCD